MLRSDCQLRCMIPAGLLAIGLILIMGGTCFAEDRSCCANGDETRSYGPCDCQPRGTLFQWSYGTSFSGGPPGRDEPLASDRPDFTEASTTVGRGVVQLESGYTYTHDDDGTNRTNSHSFP